MACLFTKFPPLAALAKRGLLLQLFSRRAHGFGFSTVRAHYINSRVRLLALLFAILTPLWIPVDYFLLEWDQFQLIAVIRLLFSIRLLVLSAAPEAGLRLYQAQRRLVVLMALPALLYLLMQYILIGATPSDFLVCYTFLPFLIIPMHCIFPLTLKEGVSLALFTIIVLSLGELYRGTLFSVRGLADLWLMVLIMGVAVWAQLSQLHMQLRLFNEAAIDPLTGLLNRRTLMKQLNYVQRQSSRTGRPVSLLMIDLDHFKQVNDRYGHQGGDRVLERFATILQQKVRSSDYVSRFGGEEFLLVLPETRQEDALLLAERILASCRSTRVILDDQREVVFSVSIGVGRVDAEVPVEKSLSHADAALYQAKAQGRDCAVQC
ncbi:MAG: diguanylate cyclase (GGDEF)-like protein [Motiliproteus sp.]|jgi:diguanylate cyclase (GGDEF)-like protein